MNALKILIYKIFLKTFYDKKKEKKINFVGPKDLGAPAHSE